MKRYIIAMAAFMSFFVVSAMAQSPQVTSKVWVNAGDPADAQFFFGSIPGATVLIVQCPLSATGGTSSGKAELITNFEIYGEQQASQFFPIVCTETVKYDHYGNRSMHFTVDATPFTVHVTPQNFDLTVENVSWQATPGGCGRYCSVGTAQIAY